MSSLKHADIDRAGVTPDDLKDPLALALCQPFWVKSLSFA
jgi:hypothetical protein